MTSSPQSATTALDVETYMRNVANAALVSITSDNAALNPPARVLYDACCVIAEGQPADELLALTEAPTSPSGSDLRLIGPSYELNHLGFPGQFGRLLTSEEQEQFNTQLSSLLRRAEQAERER